MEISVFLSGIAVLFTVGNSVRTWWRDRRSDALADARNASQTSVALVALEGRMKHVEANLARVEDELGHAVRAEMMGSHLAALEARMKADNADTRAEVRALSKREAS